MGALGGLVGGTLGQIGGFLGRSIGYALQEASDAGLFPKTGVIPLNAEIASGTLSCDSGDTICTDQERYAYLRNSDGTQRRVDCTTTEWIVRSVTGIFGNDAAKCENVRKPTCTIEVKINFKGGVKKIFGIGKGALKCDLGSPGNKALRMDHASIVNDEFVQVNLMDSIKSTLACVQACGGPWLPDCPYRCYPGLKACDTARIVVLIGPFSPLFY